MNKEREALKNAIYSYARSYYPDIDVKKLAGRKRTYKGPKKVWVNNKIQELMVLEEYLNEYLEKNKDFKKGRITKPFTRKEAEDNDN